LIICLESNENGKILINENSSDKPIAPPYSGAYRIDEAARIGSIYFRLRIREDNYNPIIIKDGNLVSISEWSVNRPGFLSVAIAGHYSGNNRSIKVGENAYLVNFQNSPGSLYYYYRGGLTDLDGNSVDIKDKVAGIVRDSNGVPRNVISNITL